MCTGWPEERGISIPADPADDHRSGGRPRSKVAHAAILDATLDLLAEVGYSRLTVEGIAARAGVGKTTVYRWWPSKSALVVEAIGTQLDTRSVEPTGDVRADVRAAVTAAAASYGQSAVGAAVAGVVVDLMRDPDAAEPLGALLPPQGAVVREIVARAAERGELPADTDVELLQEVVAGTLLYRTLVSRRPVDGVDDLVDLVLDGLMPRERRG